VITREILPNAWAPLVSEFGLRFCFNFLFIAGLSFLGLGIQPPYADLGGMVRENAAAINFGMMAPIYPATAIALLTVSVNLVVDWMLSIDARPSGACGCTASRAMSLWTTSICNYSAARCWA
jgi:peptide/nickel transport system permease protein